MPKNKKGKGRGRGSGVQQAAVAPPQAGQQAADVPQLPQPGQQVRTAELPVPPGFAAARERTGTRHPPGFAAVTQGAVAGPPPGLIVGAPTHVSPGEHPAAQPLLHPEPSKKKIAAGPELTDITKTLATITMKERSVHQVFKMPRRPGVGTKGQKIKLIANHFEVVIPGGSVFHYDVEIEQLKTLKPGEQAPSDETERKAKPQQVTGRRVPAAISRDIIMNKLKESYPREFRNFVLAYDGNKNLYTRKPLPFNTAQHFIISFAEEGRDCESRFKVSIKPVVKEGTNNCEVDLAPLNQYFQRNTSSTADMPQEAITALDIILRSGPSTKLFPVRSSFFNIPRNPRDKAEISGGHEIWFGFYQSLRPGQWKPLLVINKSATTFYPAGPVLDFFIKYLNKRSVDDLIKINPGELHSLNKEMKNVKIQVNHLPYRRKYRVEKVITQSANQKTFLEEKNGQKRKITIEQYFRENYKPLKYPHLPCLQVGNPVKDICLPVEVCELVLGQHYRRKLTPQQTSEMIRFTATPPAERFRDIQQCVNGLTAMSQNYLKEFGLQISPQPLHIEGRVLDAPKVQYDKMKTIMPYQGAWDMKNHQFFKGCEIPCWAILSLADERFVRPDMIDKLADMLTRLGREMGIVFSPVSRKLSKGRDAMRMGNLHILQSVKNELPQLKLLVIILGRNSDYKDIKMNADTKIGLMTQCIRDENVVRKCNPQLITNILQKINAKMGGVNCSLKAGEKPAIFERPVIIIGADVSHPAPGDKIKPSVAAAVGSLDSYPCRYACAVDVQRSNFELLHRVERIVNLDIMVAKLLRAFYKHTTKKPERIIFFRDGVSEGQFADVQENEIPLIRKACTSLQADYQPTLTFIVVQKRHHTRFMPEMDRDGMGKCKNVPPGTMVDQDVTSPADFDFFLCSHFGIQGTSRPAHYTVIWDENNFTADELHKLTYHLCHTYVRCTRSISIPAPVNYAHLAAFRASHHLESNITSPSGSEASSTSDNDAPLSPEIARCVVTKAELGNMYYV